MAKWIKNIDTVDHTWSGQLIIAGAYYEIQSVEDNLFSSDDQLITDIGNTKAIMAKDDSGTKDITGISDSINYLKNIDDRPRDYDGRETVHQSSRTHGFTTYFSGADDDHTDPHKTGGSTNIQDLCWDHKIGEANPLVLYCDLNTAINETQIHEGYLQWKDSINDYVSFEIVPKLTLNTSAGTNTNYNLFGGYLILPAAGDGTLVVNDVDRVLVEVPKDLDTGALNGAGYFDATWNTTTKQFDSITPNYTGTGQYNMFTFEVSLNRFVNRQHCLGDGFIHMQTSDKSQLGQNMRIKLSAHTRLPDHDWLGNATMVLHRKSTI